MIYKVLFLLCFLFQVYFLSFKLIKSADGIIQNIRPNSIIFRLFLILVAVFFLTYYLIYDPQVELTLVFLGAFFVLQLSFIIARYRYKEFLLTPFVRSTKAIQDKHIQMKFVVAAIMVVAYIIFWLTTWGGSLDKHFAQLIVFVSTNVFLALFTVISIYSIENSSTDKLLLDSEQTISLSTYISIAISVYYLGKYALQFFDLNDYRPTMMSLFMTVLAYAILSTVFKRINGVLK